MGTIVTILIKWIVQKVGAFAVILAILLGGAWLRSEWRKLREATSEVSKTEGLHGGMKAELQRIESEISRRQPEWRKKKEEVLGRIQREMDDINRDIEKAGKEAAAMIKKLADLEQTATEARKEEGEAKRKRDDLRKQVGWWQKRFAPFSKPNWQKVQDLETAEIAYILRKKGAETAEATRDLLRSRIKNSAVSGLNEHRNRKEEEITRAKEALDPEEQEWIELEKRKKADISSVEELLKAKRERIAQDPRQRFLAALQSQLPTAAWILLGIVVTPVLLKAVCYYGLAPLAARLPPIRVLSAGDIPPMPEPVESAVSQSIDIGGDEEILVHSDYLQSSSQNSVKRTQWLLNPSIPFSSIASGMWILTRIQPADEETTRVVISSHNDAFGEIGIIELPEGAAMVVHPRSLAGVVKRRGAPIRIMRHWRLFSLHAWLTFQLRYLVFHGPCKLVMKGCRGIRAEQPDADQPRMINQNATIGFSANLEYRNTRCETFVSYLRGKEDLFNDVFAGNRGFFVYEEMPVGGRKTGITGRGLEGILDAALKVFGL